MRKKIIQIIRDRLIDNPHVFAFWLEGSDGLNAIDEYSDIDIVLDVEDGAESDIFSIVEDTLEKLGELDLNYEVNHGHPKIRQKIYHICNSSEYLIIDCDIQSHSRDKEESIFQLGDIVSFPKVIFDKSSVVSIKEQKEEIDIGLIRERIEDLKARYKQHARVIKYVKRKHFAEAFMYYTKYVADPLVELTRLLYTPKYHYLHMIHISSHVPTEEVKKLEEYYKLSSLDDISNLTIQSQVEFNNLIDRLNKKYSL